MNISVSRRTFCFILHFNSLAIQESSFFISEAQKLLPEHYEQISREQDEERRKEEIRRMEDSKRRDEAASRRREEEQRLQEEELIKEQKKEPPFQHVSFFSELFTTFVFR